MKLNKASFWLNSKCKKTKKKKKEKKLGEFENQNIVPRL